MISKILFILGSYKFLAYLEHIRSYAWSFGHSDPDKGSVVQPIHLDIIIYKRRPTAGVLPMKAENRNSCETGKKFLRFYITRLLVHSLTVHSPSFV